MAEGTQAWIRAMTAVGALAEDSRPLAVRLIGQPSDRPALLSNQGDLTYRQLAARINQYAHWALAIGLQPGEAVALMMPNCSDYVAFWLGVSRVGGVVALLNTGLRQDGLAHAIGVAHARHVVTDASLTDAVQAVRSRFGPSTCFWVCGTGAEGWRHLDADAMPREPVAAMFPAALDRALLIYTSGTTGLPKAVGISHGRVLEWSFWFAGMMDTGPDDRMYDCLPMYHSIGGVVAVGAMLVRGGSVVIRPGFSASRFWDDVAEGQCTIFQYIGELCRYLVNAPPHRLERTHQLRLACGNGLRAEIWTRFANRFQIPRVLEYYAATEGSVSLYNVEGKPGAIGRVPAFLAHRFPVALIRCDPGTGTPSRDDAGLCQRCAPDEMGEAIGPVPAQGLYTDPAATAKKILHDVFKPGDAWFRTGDLMRRDGAGFFTFVDRIGDTFRWKGENVATTEVAEALGRCPGVVMAVVYGVTVPGNEGRAGMAALETGPGFDLAALFRHLATLLPDYACPVFLRISATIDTTGTLKPLKAGLARDGFDPAVVRDPLYILDRALGRYVSMDAGIFARMAELRL